MLRLKKELAGVCKDDAMLAFTVGEWGGTN